MCGRFTLDTTWAQLHERFRLIGAVEPRPRFNIAPTQPIRIVRRAPAGNELAEVRWGLIPAWAKDPKIGSSCINARAETLGEKPAFRSAWREGRRCLVPASGFFEWAKSSTPKQPYLLRPKGGGLVAFAGLWETWRPETGAPIETCTIVTTDASDLVRPLHDRMPVILRPESFEAWLDPSTPPAALTVDLGPDGAPELEAIAVGPLVNSPKNEDRRCVEPAAR